MIDTQDKKAEVKQETTAPQGDMKRTDNAAADASDTAEQKDATKL